MHIKDVPGYEGKYAITEDGKVWAYPNVKGAKYGTWMKWIIKDGYPHVGLRNGKKQHSFRVHVLVAKTYIDNPNNLPIVMHIDDNRMNPSVNNLKWGTLYDNNLDARNKNRAYKGGHSLVKKELIVEGFENKFESLNAAARALKVDVSTICKSIKRGNMRVKGLFISLVN